MRKQKYKNINDDPLIKGIKSSLSEQVALSAKGGFDVAKHWKEMLATLKK